MIFFLPLAIYTALIIFFAIRIWKRTRQVSFLIGFFFFYYWSLLGAWFLIFDDVSGGKGADIGLHHYIYFQKLFQVNIDFDYFLSMTYYALFIIGVQLVILYFLKKRKVEASSENKAIEINYGILLLGSVVAIIASYVLVWPQIVVAAETDLSIYYVTRTTENAFFPVHQLLNQAAIISLFIALVSYFSGPNARYIKGGESMKMYVVLFVVTLFIVSAILLLGNKREILFGGIFAMVFYLMNSPRIEYKKVTIILSFVIIPLFFNDSLRGYSPSFLKGMFGEQHLVEKPQEDPALTSFSVKNATFAFLFSNEMFCGHFSMYGVVHKKVPFTYGSSLKSLGVSFVPRFILNDRPEDIYTYYVREVGAMPGQGYTINHATGWYINFWIPGILLGAFLFGWLWVTFYHKTLENKAKNTFVKIFFILALPCFTAAIPSLMRSGPEAYKAVAYEYLLIPTVILFLSYYIKLKTRKAN